MFKKDGEIKVFISKKDGKKTASADDSIRYTVDDLVKNSKEKEEEEEEEEEEKKE